jgi:hypothetical protein
MPTDDAQRRATEFLKELYAAGSIDVGQRLDPPLPGLPLIRLDVTAMIGWVHLRHPGPSPRTRRWRRARTA